MFAAAALKYVAFARIAAARARRDRGELYGRMLFFAVILGVFASLWRAIADAGMPIAADPRQLVWYLATTEWIILSAPPIHVDLQESIRRGDVVCCLGRPVSYVGSAFAEALGLLAVRAPLLAATAWICAFAFTRWMPPVASLAWTLPFGFAAAALITGMHLWIGLLTFWLDDVSPVFWVAQKLLFVFGGLMLPIELYPNAMQAAAALTPFPTMLAGPASFVLRQNGGGSATLAVRMSAWGVVTAVAVWYEFRRAHGTLTINGG
ncbi:MAG TPA: ABC-2 family transporter protein [Vicinamibacterales bacterium]|nr:ABC-2 family transporter protein [Vicinamibacterales bacterium]